MLKFNKNKNGSGSYEFSESNYKSGYCGSGYKLKDDIPQGNATYDATRKNMREPWMIPTKTQLRELVNNTTSTWTGSGRKYTSKSDTSKYIFLPAAGLWNNTSHESVGSLGDYWSSDYKSASGLTSPSGAYSMWFDSGGHHYDGAYRQRGRSIRAIRQRLW